MEYEFYADVFFLSNLYMDFLTVYAVNVILEKKKKTKRLIAGCAMGSLAGLLLYLGSHNYGMYLLLMHFFINPVMVVFCFMPAKKELLLKAWFLMYLISLLLGGSVEWMYQTLTNGKYYEVCLLLSAVPLLIFLFILRQKRRSVHLFYDVTVFNKGRCAQVRAYFDTGNLLKDPYVGLPVHVVGEKVFETLGGNADLMPRFIPYTSVGKPSGMIRAVTVEEIKIMENGRETAIAPAVLAVADDLIFQGKNYEMILNYALEEKLQSAEIVENERRNGEKRCT